MTTINLFRNSRDTRDVPAGHCIFVEGEDAGAMFAVIEGEVEIRYRGQPLETVREGGIFGEMALISDQPRSASATAMTDCKLVAIDEKRFTYLIQQTPFFALQVMRIMADRLRRETSLAVE
jgi:CRP-like cAMP-binding protein